MDAKAYYPGFAAGSMGSDDVVHLGHRSVLQAGNSLSITIPSEVAKFIRVEAGDTVAVRFDRETDELRIVTSTTEAEQISAEV